MGCYKPGVTDAQCGVSPYYYGEYQPQATTKVLCEDKVCYPFESIMFIEDCVK